MTMNDDGLDLIFRKARTHNVWLDKPVDDALLRRVYDLAKMGPTSANMCPMRIVFVKSREAKERLKPALDAGNVVTRRLRLRPSVDFGLFHGPNTYVGALEAAYRFTADAEPVTPYAGGGVAVAGHDGCGADPACPALWATFVLGFEIHYRSTFNWLLEYRGMAGFRHNRVYVGLTTRRGT